MSENPGNLTNADKRKIDALFYPLQFKSLLEVATETCLSEALPDVGTPPPANPEARVVQQLGYHGLRTALEIELADNKDTLRRIDAHRSQSGDDDEKAVYYDTAMRSIAYFSDEVDQKYIIQARQFGDALMRESFAILGPDANEQLEKFITAETVDVQLEVATWLNKRCIDLTENINLSDEVVRGPLQYHPARLSPKLIGEFPNHALPPTCLGVSIIAAEFFRRAGCETLQAGVMWSHSESGLKSTLGLMGIQAYDRQRDGHVTQIEEETDKKRKEIEARLYADNAYHAAVYAKFKDGTWLQFDSNYRNTCLFIEEISSKLQRTFDTLTEIDEVAPGMEVAVNLGSAFTLSLLSAYYTRELIEYPTTVLDAVLEDVLATGESVAQRIYDAYVVPAFMQSSPNQTTTYAQRYIEALQTNVLNEPTLQTVFYKVFQKFVLWGQPVDVVIDRCRKDEAYYQRFKADIVHALPAILLQLCLTEWSDNSLEPVGTHLCVEAGLPEARIGMSVLSDFAQYCDNALPPSFWLSHWASRVPVTATMQDVLSEPQAAILWNNIVLNHESLLTYTKSDGIVDEFVERSSINPRSETSGQN